MNSLMARRTMSFYLPNSLDQFLDGDVPRITGVGKRMVEILNGGFCPEV